MTWEFCHNLAQLFNNLNPMLYFIIDCNQYFSVIRLSYPIFFPLTLVTESHNYVAAQNTEVHFTKTLQNTVM